MASVRRRLFYMMLLCGILLASCGGTATEESGEADVNAILTAGVGTLAASIFETQTALAPIPTDTSPPVEFTSTNTALPLPSPAPSSTQGLVFVPVISTGSPSPTGTLFTPTPNPSSLGAGCNNLLLISDVNVPAGAVMKPNEPFTKTWKVQNNGTCEWALQFRLAFAGGNQMDGNPGGLGKVISPQKWTQISVELIAPKKPGAYTGSWRLSTQSGTLFGSTLTVSIVVAAPTNTPLPPTNTQPPTSTFTVAPPTSTSTDTPAPPTETITLTPP
ncbi:MAG TPA: NBR1-Ig-like domain-containing protein [Anaerolineales bacterium]|nr:NBR1-Ig-like domain-containing protein [Anaerolineales bacterium]